MIKFIEWCVVHNAVRDDRYYCVNRVDNWEATCEFRNAMLIIEEVDDEADMV